MDKNIHPTVFKISKELRANRLRQIPRLIWFTGLSGSGKSTLANAVETKLYEKGFHTYLLDGDNIRTGLSRDLGFSEQDRVENIRRIGEVGNLLLDAGTVVLSAFISPFRKDRELIAELVGEENFLEIFVDCPLEICEQRDVKGLYKKARNGLIKNFTGIDSPYEAPESPFIKILSHKEQLSTSVDRIVEAITKKISY